MLLPEGLICTSFSPFKADNSLDEKVLAEQLQMVTEGSGGLLGPTGGSEFASLTFEEWQRWIEILVEVAHGAGIKAWGFLGAESYEKTIRQMDFAIKAGVDGVFVIAPYFNLYSQDEAYSYYADLAAAYPDVAINFYPSHQTGNHFTPQTIARIAALPNIVGMKLNGDASYDEVSKTILLTKDIDPFRWVTGGLNMLYPLMKGIDIQATLSPMSSFAHDWSLTMWSAYQAKDWPTVEEWHRKLGRIASVLNVAGHRQIGGRAGHKAALAVLGRPVGRSRRPALPTSDEHVARIRKVFEEEGLM